MCVCFSGVLSVLVVLCVGADTSRSAKRASRLLCVPQIVGGDPADAAFYEIPGDLDLESPLVLRGALWLDGTAIVSSGDDLDMVETNVGARSAAELIEYLQTVLGSVRKKDVSISGGRTMVLALRAPDGSWQYLRAPSDWTRGSREMILAPHGYVLLEEAGVSDVLGYSEGRELWDGFRAARRVFSDIAWLVTTGKVRRRSPSLRELHWEWTKV